MEKIHDMHKYLFAILEGKGKDTLLTCYQLRVASDKESGGSEGGFESLKNCHHFDTVDVQAGPGAECQAALAQSSPTRVGSIGHNNLPSGGQSQLDASLIQVRGLPRGHS